ncbi:MAG TPA: dihydrolipoyl dehydrogenase [Tepidisphaeraceae bacterium]|jgi:dihydrolipoamide dehydrogenase|nr:dihydrolipoyl dehydrogenase [Tepidisphaeraceae bacterium]
MSAEITMPQLSDTMTDGIVVKWNKQEGQAVKQGEEIAEIETDKATMPMEAFESGVLAYVAAKEGAKVPVGGLMAVIATTGEKAEEVKKKYASGGAAAAKPQAAEKAPVAVQPKSNPPAAVAAKAPAAPVKAVNYNFDVVVIGGGPAGYAAAIRAGQLKKRTLCIEKAELGGTCLNWGCIPTKALLEDGAFVRKLRTEAAGHGVSFDNLKIDFAKIVGRSRAIAEKLSKGIAHLFRKYEVKHEQATGQIVGPHKVRFTPVGGQAKEVTAEHIIIATGAKATPLPFAAFDGKAVITSREAMNLPAQPKRLAIIGAGAIGCEFADFYNAIGTEVTVVEMLPQLLPNEDADVALLLERSFTKRGIKVLTKTKTDKVEKTSSGVKLTLSGEKSQTIEADLVLVAIGVTGNTDGLVAEGCKLELFKNRVKVTPELKTNLENVYAIGDCISLHWPEQDAMAGYRHPDLAHVAHHEAVNIVERICGVSQHAIDYRYIPGCTYTHPQVASFGQSEKKLRDAGRQIKVGKFPFSASGRALAAGESEGFVKLIFDAKYGELLGVHMIGENVTELLSELVLAHKLEATEAEIIETMHPHPTLSEAVMEAAGVADGRAIHL